MERREFLKIFGLGALAAGAGVVIGKATPPLTVTTVTQGRPTVVKDLYLSGQAGDVNLTVTGNVVIGATLTCHNLSFNAPTKHPDPLYIDARDFKAVAVAKCRNQSNFLWSEHRNKYGGRI